MTGRALPGVARTSRSLRVFNFGRCDNVLPWPAVFAGGGNRTRRRIHGAVGPERTNDLVHSNTFADASWTKSNATLTPGVADPFGGTEAYTLTATGGGYGVLQQVIAAGSSALRVNSIWLRRRAGSGNINHWSPDGVTPTILSGLSSDWKRYDAANLAAGTGRTFVIEMVGSGDEIDVYEAQLEMGFKSTPNIRTGVSAVTTTDWPRVNELTLPGFEGYIDARKGYTSQIYNGGSSIEVTVRMPDGSTGAATKYSGPDGVTLRFGGTGAPSALPRFGFVFARAALDAALVRTDVNDQDSREWTLTEDWQRIGSFDNLAPNAYQFLDVRKLDDNDIILAWAYVAVNDAGLTEFPAWHEGDVVTPPYGELVTVAADHPRIEYDASGVGLGVKLFGAAYNNLKYSDIAQVYGDGSGHWFEYTTGAASVSVQKLWDAKQGHFLRITKTAGAVGDRAGVGTSEVIDLGGTDGLSVGVMLRRSSEDATGYAPYLDAGKVGGGLITAATFIPPGVVVGEWLLAGGAAGGGMSPAGSGSFYIWLDGPVGTYFDVCRPQCNSGQVLTEYVAADGAAASSDAELITYNLSQIGLDGDEWTLIAKAQEPAATSAFPMVVHLPGAGDAYMSINKQPGGAMSFDSWDGVDQRLFQVAGQAAGTVRTFALGFSRAAGILRGGATGEPVQTVQFANLQSFPALSALHLGGGAGWQMDGIFDELRVAPRLLTVAEMTSEIAK